MLDSLLTPGSLIQFSYPRHNFRCVRRQERCLRRVRVDAVRDLRDEPLEAATLEAEPNLARGKLLIKAFDLDKQATRHFYVESMTDLSPLAAPPQASARLFAVIARDGQFVRFTDMPDPRHGFCNAFNRLSREHAVSEVAIPA